MTDKDIKQAIKVDAIDETEDDTEDEVEDGSGTPKFGRLLIVLILVVLLICFITFASEWFYT